MKLCTVRPGDIPSFVAGLIVFLVAGNAAASPEQFLVTYCVDCHQGAAAEAGLDFEKLPVTEVTEANVDRWIRVYDRVRRREMPPADHEPRPPRAEGNAFLAAVRDRILKAESDTRETVLRRLNRVEYQNTLRDLFGVRIDVKEVLPPDASLAGFDTVGEALAVSTEQLVAYLEAADLAITQALGPDKPPPQAEYKKPFGDEVSDVNKPYFRLLPEGTVLFNSTYSPSHFFQAPCAGTYRVRFRMRAFQSEKPVILRVYGGDTIAPRSDVQLAWYGYALPEKETEVEFTHYLRAFRQSFHILPANTIPNIRGGESYEGAGVLVSGPIEVEGPLEAWPPPSRRKLLGDVELKAGTQDDLRPIVSRFLPAAFRRPVTAEEIDFFTELGRRTMAQKATFEAALRTCLKAILVSPEFLFLEERPVDGRIAPHALAARLSYFLWSSMPDEQLLTLASAGRLASPEVLREQVERMLADPKAESFVGNFVGQWLNLRAIDDTQPDRDLYPEYDDMLRAAMLAESEAFFREVLDNNLSVVNFVDSDWTFLNERLARHYGIQGIEGTALRKVDLPAGSIRGGVMTHASVLKVTANGTNTSPVLRGTWVLENIIGQRKPQPPPNIPAVEPDTRGVNTIRQLLEKHREAVACRSCHQSIDPPGFALESFDPTGQYRDRYRTLGEGEPVDKLVNEFLPWSKVKYRTGPPVDPSGAIDGRHKFHDIREFKRLMADRPERIARCLAQKLLVYGTGRQLGFSDRPQVKALVEKASKDGYGLRSLIHAVVESPIFQQP